MGRGCSEVRFERSTVLSPSRPGGRWRVIVRRSAVIAWGLMCAACGAASVPHLFWPGSGSYTDAYPAAVGEPIVFSELVACSRPAGPVRIVAIRAADPRGGLRVTGWGYQPTDWSPDKEHYSVYTVPLAKAGFRQGPVTMSTACADSTEGQTKATPLTFAIVLERTGPTTAFTVGVTIDYVSDGQKLSMTIPATLGICSSSKGPRDPQSPCR